MEEWRVIDNYPDYQVNNTGLVRSIKFNKVKVRSPSMVRGYWSVVLCVNNKISCHRVHRLVALAFIPNPDGKKEVDHINRIKTDNRIENLRWATSSENCINVPTRAEHRHIVHVGNQFRVQIQRNNKWVHYRFYKTLDEAIAARDAFLISLTES
jgi:hypothetical protein